MEAYNLLSFTYDKMEGVFNVELQYTLNEEIQTDRKQFRQLGSADLYIKHSKKSWLLTAFEIWLLEIKHILEKSPNEKKENVFKNVWLIYEEFIQCELHIICERILKGSTYLRDLCETDNMGTLKSIEQILSFCKAECEAMKF